MDLSTALRSPRLLAAFAIFAVTRLLILLGYGEHVSDVHLYHEAATRAVVGGETAYADFFFPYPPLALPLVYLPVLFAQEFAAYRKVFQLEMLVFDLLCLALVYLLMRRLGRSERETALAVTVYSLMGLAVGHLLYDRLDLVVAAAFTALLLLLPTGSRERWRSRATAWAGALVKLMPLLLVPLIWLAAPLLGPAERWRRRWIEVARDAALYLAPPLAVLVAWNLAVGGALFRYLGQHGERGIEVSSVWATPFWLYRRFVLRQAMLVDSNFGAQHLRAEMVGEGVVLLSKLLGALLLVAFFVALGWLLWRRRAAEPGFRLSHDLFFFAGLAALLLFLAGQRILSPQYFIWTMPVLAAFVVRPEGRWALPLTAAVYYLTWEGFRRGYWPFVEGHPYFVVVYALRNLLLVTLAAVVVWQVFRVARSE